MDKFIIGIALVGVIGLLGWAIFSKNQSNNQGIILYYGNTCPHCEDLEKFIKANDIESKVSFERKEVFLSKSNSSEMGQKAAKCGLQTDVIGVPFMWTGSTCLLGNDQIEKFLLAEKAK